MSCCVYCFKAWARSYFQTESFRYRIRNLFKGLGKARLVICVLFLGLTLPGEVLGSGFSIVGSVAGGEEDALAYELGARYTFEPWIDGMVALRPLVEVSGFAWDGTDDTVWGASASIGLTLDLVTSASVQPFVTGTIGAALLSDNRIGNRKLGKHAQIKSRGAAGLRFGETLSHTIYFEVTHYSNARTHCENSGFTSYGGGYAYTF